MELDEAREAVYRAGLDLVKEGLVARTWGNISVRLDDYRFVITPSGRTYETLKPGEMVVVKMGDLSHEGTIKPSSEKGMHAAVYLGRPEITAVVHTHQLFASTVAAARKGIKGLSKAHARVLGSGVACAAYALPGSKKLKRAAATALEGDRRAALLANHGALCIGETMAEAFDVAKTLEAACECFIAQSFMEKYEIKGTDLPSTEQMHRFYLEKEI
ncbi:MAG: class II aldolase/adducin family protein [Desulfobacterium sp.]|nr:class II aldolase/adducin family protein [Desulfobacterium sp.]